MRGQAGGRAAMDPPPPRLKAGEGMGGWSPGDGGARERHVAPDRSQPGQPCWEQ